MELHKQEPKKESKIYGAALSKNLHKMQVLGKRKQKLSDKLKAHSHTIIISGVLVNRRYVLVTLLDVMRLILFCSNQQYLLARSF